MKQDFSTLEAIEAAERELQSLTDLIAEIGITVINEAPVAIIYPSLPQVCRQNVLNISETLLGGPFVTYNCACAPDKHIYRCLVVSSPLPRTASGAIAREALPSLALPPAAPAYPSPLPTTPEFQAVWQLLQENFSAKPLQPNFHFELDMGMDSLDKVAFLSLLTEKFGMVFPEQLLVEYPTPVSLAGALAEMPTAIKQDVEQFSWKKYLQTTVPEADLPSITMFHDYFDWILLKFFQIAYNFSETGSEWIPEGPCIFAPNHQSFLDAPAVSAILTPKELCDTSFLAKAKYPSGKLIKWFARRGNVVHVHTNHDIGTTLQKLGTLLQQGKKIAIFPEGTRTFDGDLLPFKPTFAILAKEFNVPIIPIAIDGTFDCWPRMKKFPTFRKKITIHFLTPVVASPQDTYQDLVRKTRQAIQEDLDKSRAIGERQ